MMSTFVDESGDIGPGEKSTPYFRIAAVWFHDSSTIQAYLDVINQLKTTLGVSQNFEFHFARINHERRMAFFMAVSDQPFYYAVVSFEKRTFDRKTLTKEAIRETSVAGLVNCLEGWYLTEETCRNEDSGLKEKIVFDECNDQSYIRLLKHKFRDLSSTRGPKKKLIGTIRPGKSSADPCLQLADMVCGAVGRHLDGDSRYYPLLKTKEKEMGIETIVGSGGETERGDRPLLADRLF